MLSEFIQFKLIKSHPQLPKQTSSKCYDTKLSFQLSTNTQSCKVQSGRGLLSSKNSNNNQNIYTKNFSSKIDKNEDQFSSRRSQFVAFHKNDSDHSDHSRSKIPLILSPKKLSLLKKQETSLEKRIPMIQSQNYKQLIKNQYEEILLNSQKIARQSKISAFQATTKSTNLIKSSKISLSSLSKGKNNYILRGITQQSLSPLKQKISLLKKHSNLQNLMKKQTSAQKRLKRSDSFRTAILKSREKRKTQKQNIQQNSNTQNRLQQLNNQYYSENCQNLKKLEVIKKKYQLGEKIIKDPTKKILKCSKRQSVQQKNSSQQKNIAETQKKVNFFAKKVDSFIQQSVNNSNLLYVNEMQERSLTMQPF